MPDSTAFEHRLSLSGFLAGGFFIVLSLAPVMFAARAVAQSTAEEDPQRARAVDLYKQGKYIDALPLFESLAEQRPSDVAVHSMLGACILAKASTLTDDGAQKKERLRARAVLLQAQKLGDKTSLTQILLDQLSPDGSISPFSERKEVDEAIREGEAAFANGDFERALAAYNRALILDPKQYAAALFTGDVYFNLKQMDKAGDWFARAIEIDPSHETAYRYWGDALLMQNKTREAREKYMDAILAEPYNRAPWSGLNNWTQRKQVKLTPPQIQSPHQLSEKDGTPNITIDAKSLSNGDGTLSWLVYEVTCKAWRDELFAREFPAEKTYRHSLPEEAAALRKVVESVNAQMKEGKIVALDPSLATLVKLNDQGLLEAYILLSRADQGIAQDYPAYRKDHRDKLKQYLDQWVIPVD